MDQRVRAAMPYLRTRGLTEKTAEEYVLTYDKSSNGILIPYFDMLGRMRGVARRNLNHVPGSSWPPKYEWLSGARHLYNVRDADNPYVFLTEGEFDCLVLKQLGLSAVAVPGVKNFKKQWAWLFAGKTIYLCFDADPPQEVMRGERKVLVRPGQDAMLQLKKTLARVTNDVQIITLPEGQDINSLYLAGSLEGILGL